MSGFGHGVKNTRLPDGCQEFGEPVENLLKKKYFLQSNICKLLPKYTRGSAYLRVDIKALKVNNIGKEGAELGERCWQARH